MPSYTKKVKIPGKTSDELYRVLSEDIDRFLTKASFGSFEIDRRPAEKQLLIKSKLFSATLSCQDAQMELDAKLSLMAVPFRSKLDEGINRWLARNFKITDFS